MDFSSYKALKLERDENGILTITFNRPDSLNAVDAGMDEELGRVFTEAGYDEQTRVVILTGAGRAFSAGGDLEEMQLVIDEPQRFIDGMRRGKQLLFSMLDCPKPIIAKINGHAIGLGATLALFCDLTYATLTAKIGDPHVSVGFVAGDGGAAIWPQLIGYAKAKEYLLTGEALTGEEAARIGLINHAVTAEELDETVQTMALKLAQGASKAIQWTKLAVNISLKQIVSSVIDASFAYEALSNQTEDHQEAVNAFREKRKPVFKGR
ncbi:enoyl-CoA hydratase/isomerase family protein [Pseudomonas marginalis]|uniref:enoyl-CoA hydratase/isomerase family protein n=1 Tax=Pseudomonas marginalis TaxID=298 RepID=UPI002B1CE1B6|nr:enoyl-CoA hydratase-related protein [Pseudomonas marginalis]